MASSPSPRRRAHVRRWRILPPPVSGSDSVAGLGILHENTGELGGLLWRCLRAVHAWSATVPADRGELFAPETRDQRMADLLTSDAPEALERSLGVLVEMVGDPVRIGVDRVGLACAGVAAWATSAGKHATSAEFTHAAARACPGSPSHALASARVSRDQGRYAEAEAMYQHTVALARQVGDWDSYTRAHAALGKVAQQRGAYPTARHALQRALRSAERRSIRPLRAMVLHDLFVVETECGRDEEAELYAEAAAQAYAPGHQNLTALAGDVAVFWMNRGRFSDALAVFQRILPLNRKDRLLTLGHLARTAGAVGDRATFGAAFSELMEVPDDAPRQVDALQYAADGAINLGALDEAEAAGGRALALAEARGENWTVFRMEAVLDQAARLRRAANTPKEIVPVEATPEATTAPCSLLRTLERVLVPAGAGS